MSAIHTTYFFATQGQPEVVEAQCDVLMQNLLAMEAADPRVTDSTVSVDLGTGIVEVEAYAVADNRDEAEDLIAVRINTAVAKTVSLLNAVERERRIELVDA